MGGPGTKSKMNLSVKGVKGELVVALECVGVRLIHDQAVSRAAKDFSLVNKIKTTHYSLLLFPFHNHFRPPLPSTKLSNSCGFFLVSVLVDYLWLGVGDNIQKLSIAKISAFFQVIDIKS